MNACLETKTHINTDILERLENMSHGKKYERAGYGHYRRNRANFATWILIKKRFYSLQQSSVLLKTFLNYNGLDAEL